MPKTLVAAILTVLLVASLACTTEAIYHNADIAAKRNVAQEQCDTNEAAVISYLFTERIKLWKYVSATHWCYDGTQITSDPVFTTEATIYGIANLFYRYEGDRITSNSGGSGELSYTDYAEGHFKFGAPEDLHFNIGFITLKVDLKKLTAPVGPPNFVQAWIARPRPLEWYPSIWKYQYADGNRSHDTDRDDD